MKKIITNIFVFCFTFFIFLSFIASFTQVEAVDPPSTFPVVEPAIKPSSYLDTGAPRFIVENYSSIFQHPFSFFESSNIRRSTWYYTDYYCQNDSGNSKIVGDISKYTALVNVYTGHFQTYEFEVIAYPHDVAYCVPNTCVDSPKTEAPLIRTIEDIDNYRNDVIFANSSCQLLIGTGGQCTQDVECRSGKCNAFHKCDDPNLIPGFEKTNPDPIDDYFGGPFTTPDPGNENVTPTPIPNTDVTPTPVPTCSDLSCGEGQTCIEDNLGAYCADKLIEGMYCASTSQCADNLTCNTSTSTCTSDETVPPASSKNNDANFDSQFCNAEESYCTGDSQEPCQCNNGKQCNSESVLFCQDYL